MANRTLSQLRGEVYVRLAEGGGGFYTDAQINQWLTDGVRALSTVIEPLRTTATTTPVADTAEYSLPTGLLSVKLVQYLDTSSNWFNLTETTWQTLFTNRPNFENDTSGQPLNWYKRQNIIGLYPAPSATYVAADALRVMYSHLPDEMSADSDTTGLESWLDDTIILYAVYRAYLKDRDFERANATAAEYSKGVSEAAVKLNRQREEHAPRMQPDTMPYRGYYQARLRRTQITST